MNTNNKTKILKFNEFEKSVKINEGFFDSLKKTAQRIGTFAVDTAKKVWNIPETFVEFLYVLFTPKKITTGLKSGVESMAIFNPEDGDIVSQVRKFYAGTEYAKTNSLPNEYLKESLNEESVSLSFPVSSGSVNSVPNIGVEDVKRIIKKQYKDKISGFKSYPTFIYGAPGIGKTEIIAQIAQELGIGLAVLDVQFMEVSDFQGLPVPNKDTKQMDFYMSSAFPDEKTNEGKGGILFLDELPNADMYVLKKLNQFIQQSRIGSHYKLPDNWIIVAAGNRPGDHPTITDLSENPSFAERFQAFNYVPEFETWAEWVKENNKEALKQRADKNFKGTKRTYILEEILDLIRGRENLFYDLDPSKNSSGFASPRGWEKAATEIESILRTESEKDGRELTKWSDLPLEKYRNALTASIGFDTTTTLLEYLDVIKNFSEQDFEEMTTTPEKARIVNDEYEKKPHKFFGLIDALFARVLAIEDKKVMFEKVLNSLKYLKRYKNLEPIAAAMNKAIEAGVSPYANVDAWTEKQRVIFREILENLDGFSKGQLKFDRDKLDRMKKDFNSKVIKSEKVK